MDILITKVDQVDEENIVVLIDTMDLVKGSPITIPIAALDTRKAIYDLEHDAHAIEAIVREVGIGLQSTIHNLDIDPAPDPTCEWLDWKKENPIPEKLEPKSSKALDQFGGLHDKILVEFAPEAKTQLRKILSTVSDRPELPRKRKEELRKLALSPLEES